MKTEELFLCKSQPFGFRFLTLHVSHKSQFFLNSMSLVKDFFFKVGISPCASNFESKNKLKSPAVTSCFAGFILNSSNSSNKMLNTSICSFTVLASYKFIKMYPESWMETSRIKTRPSLSVAVF